ncbi:MAG: hypothetical protein AAGA48_38055 [Myxococcota bacterium]
MSVLSQAFEIRSQVAKHEKADPEQLKELLRRLPAAVRRMGLVRCLEWLDVGKKKSATGRILQAKLAIHLGLPVNPRAAASQLEEGSRLELFRCHRQAVALFDALATAQRVVENS